MAVNEGSFYVEGWLRRGDAGLVRLTAISPEGSRVELLERLARCPRPDVATFYGLPGGERKADSVQCFFEMDDGRSLRREGWVLEVEDGRGDCSGASGARSPGRSACRAPRDPLGPAPRAPS